MSKRTLKSGRAAPVKKRNRAHLGTGDAGLDLDYGNPAKLVQLIVDGLPYVMVRRFRQATGLSQQTVAGLLRVPLRTLGRRRTQGRLRPEESDRLVRVSRVFSKAIALFEGDANAATRWLSTSQPALDQHVPLDFMQTEVGSREVEDLIGRLEHGVFT